MRGKRASLSRKRADLVLLAVRYQPGDQRIAIARGMERYGAVWSDWKLYDRDTLLARLRAGRRVFTGRAAELAGDLEIVAPVWMVESSASGPVLRVGGTSPAAATDGSVDTLDLPLF